MKCTIFVVLMAVAAANAASVKTMPAPLEIYRSYPYATYPYAYSAYKTLAPVVADPIVAPIAPVVAAPNSVAVDVSSPTYVASNPGVTHVAPLPGHSESVIAENPGPAHVGLPYYGYRAFGYPYNYGYYGF